MNSKTKCPYCHSLDLQSNYQLHVGYYIPENKGKAAQWTTRKFREANNLQPDRAQILIVPPEDETWFTCRMCGVEFDDEGKVYETSKTKYV